jgi:type II restriction/modification system DNA methylase subunit YeeA
MRIPVSPAGGMTVPQFQQKWRDSRLTERSAAQQHFLDLCRLLGMPTPAEVDQEGAFYTFEKGARKTAGGQGFADVWWKDHFAWEYKRNRANLDAAYVQLLQYREDLGNPPLLVVSDLQRFEIHTNFTGTAKTVYAFTIDDLDQPATLAILRQVFSDPYSLRPETTVEAVTEAAATRFGALAGAMHARGIAPERAAHFLVQLLFCLFAEDVGLLPKGIFTKLLAYGAQYPDEFPAQMQTLLAAMRDGGSAFLERVPRFNGGLFAQIDVVPLTQDELRGLADAASLDWGSVEPAIFGTLFERSLDPAKRAQLGAHYTGRRDIERVVEPVVMAPLRRRWETVRAEAETSKAAWETAAAAAGRKSGRARERDQAVHRRREAFRAKLASFLEELSRVRILDPACGSGNFLYVALAALLDLEKAVISYGAARGLTVMYPTVRPLQLHGLEVNSYARELAQVVVWIGYLQWMIGNGFLGQPDPVLEPLETIQLQDALLDLSDPERPKEAVWPEAEFIIGNPPFLGAKRMRTELGDDYTDDLHKVFSGRLPPFSDLVCYFFEKARAEIAADRAKRAGLLATNSIRGGANRVVLDRIKESGDIFMAWDDEPWVLDGAAVRISIVGFDDGSETSHTLDGKPVAAITSALTSGVDLGAVRPLPENAGICYLGVQLSGPFDLPGDVARAMLALPLNPNGRPNRDVLKPMVNGVDITRRPRDVWVVDFGVDRTEDEAALYEAPFEYVKAHVKPMRAKSRSQLRDSRWWLFLWSRPEMRAAIANLDRYLVTPTVSKYRLFVWTPAETIANHAVVLFARQDDYFFGVLHSRAHEVWSLRMGTSLEDRPRYTPTTCFETFPLPWPPGQEPWRDPRVHAIANAAHELNERREAWLDPRDASEAELKKRTLTNLFNARPAWLAAAHAALDRAVWTAYEWDSAPEETSDEEILGRLLALNQARASSIR